MTSKKSLTPEITDKKIQSLVALNKKISDREKSEINNFIGGNVNIDNILNNNLVNFENKQLSSIYFITCKLLNEYSTCLRKSKDITIEKEFFEKFLVENCVDTINKYYNNIKKRNRKKLDKDLMCKGRKLDGHQCTRKKKMGYEFCQSHLKKLPNGRIDEESKLPKKKNKRGRKPKVEFDPRQYDNDYITLWEDIIDDQKVLVDIYNNVFSFDMTQPKYLGKKTIDNTIIPPSNTVLK